jgi:hypothetical protein
MSKSVEATDRELLTGAYRNFNERHIDAILDCLHPQVEWANGMEGGHVHGRDAVREYWTRQWKTLDPHVEPQRMEKDRDGRMIVEVHQVVRDIDGKILIDTIVHHAYRIANGLIERMDIQDASSKSDSESR